MAVTAKLYRVALRGRDGYAEVENGATKGARVGVNLYDADGSLVRSLSQGSNIYTTTNPTTIVDAVWGGIGGTLADQLDLKAQQDAQDLTITDGDAASVSTAAGDATTKANAAQAFAIQRANHTGTQSADTLTDGATNGAFLLTERTKLAGIATGATANSADAVLLARANHTGTQAQATITDLVTDLALKAPLANPTFTGNPQAPTPATSDNDTTIATTAFVQAVVAALVASAPGVLDTLDEIAAALGDDPNFAATMTTALAAKAESTRSIATTLPLTGGGNLSADRTLGINAATGAAAGSMSAADKTKLDGVASGATANSSDATLLARANHTGTQLAATISNFAATVLATVLTGLSTASAVVVAATDTVLEAIGKLQAQITALNATTGVWTPTRTHTTNIAATTGYPCQWSRVGDVVTCSGKIDIDITTASAACLLGISLPVASDLASNYQLSGVAASPSVAGLSAAIFADTVNNRASMSWVANADTANRAWHFIFSYRVL